MLFVSDGANPDQGARTTPATVEVLSISYLVAHLELRTRYF